MRNGQGQGDERTILGAPFCQPGGSSDSDSDPSPQLPDARGCVLVQTCSAYNSTSRETPSGSVLWFSVAAHLSSSLSARRAVCPVCVCCLTPLVRLRTFVHIGSFLSLASIVLSRYLLQHLPLPIISRHRLPKTLLPRCFVL